MSLNINDLPFELLSEILILLPFKQFVVESVCLKWKECVRKLMELKKTLNLFGDYSEKFRKNNGCVIDDNNIGILKKILLRCLNITQLDLRGIRVTGANTFLSIGNLCPNLQRISFGNVFNINEIEWTEFATKFGPQLTHCSIVSSIIHFNVPSKYQKILFKNFEKITHLEMETLEETEELFYYLKSYENLKELTWNPGFCGADIDYSNENIIMVLQRIEKFETELSILNQVRMHMNNLIDLKIIIDLDKEFPIINELAFSNLKNVEVKGINTEIKEAILNYNFPKIENDKLGFNHYFLFTNAQHLFEQLLNKMKNIKELTINFRCRDCDLSAISSLEHLNVLNFTDFILEIPLDYDKFINNLNVISNHKSLQNIKMKFEDRIVEIDIFDSIVNLSKKKSNAKIDIEITETFYVYLQKLHATDLLKKNNYENKLNHIKHLLSSNTRISLRNFYINFTL